MYSCGIATSTPRFDGDTRLVGDLIAADLSDRSLEHLCVKIEAESIEMSRLLPAENIARTTQLKIECGDTKPGTQIGEFAYRRKAPPRDGR
jgi:hypothetical protein